MILNIIYHNIKLMFDPVYDDIEAFLDKIFKRLKNKYLKFLLIFSNYKI